MAEAPKTGTFLGTIPKDDPRSDPFSQEWMEAIGLDQLKKMGHTPESFMKTRPEGDEGAMFEDSPSMLWIRRPKPEPEGIPMSGEYFDPTLRA